MWGVEVRMLCFQTYVDSLINKIFKILPLKQEQNSFLNLYIESVKIEMVGGCKTFPQLDCSPEYLSIINTLEFFLCSDFDLKTCKREVFKCIKLIERLKMRGDEVG